MKPRCPNCNGSIIRMGHKEKPFFCKSCNEWFSKEEVTPKQTNADRIRAMTDEELAVWIAETSHCSDWCILNEKCKSKPDNEACPNVWLNWLKQERE